jgi:glycosyltransferase involved in cell wall biosynthesis
MGSHLTIQKRNQGRHLKLSIIIPAYNEKDTIKEVVQKVIDVQMDLAEPINKEIILVDDFSTDGTREVIHGLKDKHKNIEVIFHDRNEGKGAAIRDALRIAKGDYVIIQDADLEYDPNDYVKLLAPVFAGKAVVVYGSRFTGEHRNMFFWHYLGNKFLTLTTGVLYNTTLTDMETCYKLIKKEIMDGIVIKSNRFEFEPEITAKILKRGIRIYEVPITYVGREYEEGKKITWRDGIGALWTLLKYRFVG